MHATMRNVRSSGFTLHVLDFLVHPRPKNGIARSAKKNNGCVITITVENVTVQNKAQFLYYLFINYPAAPRGVTAGVVTTWNKIHLRSHNALVFQSVYSTV